MFDFFGGLCRMCLNKFRGSLQRFAPLTNGIFKLWAYLSKS